MAETDVLDDALSEPPPERPADPVLIRLPCYEPAGVVIELTDEMLCRNTLLTGTVGSGKTTTLNGILKQLISYGSPEERPGLFIIDSKRDETVEKIRQYAREAGREEDVMVLEPKGDYYYPLIETLKDFDSIPRLLAQLFSSYQMQRDDSYWVETCKKLCEAALTIALVNKLNGKPVDYFTLFKFLSDWLCGQVNEPPMLAEFNELCAQLHEPELDPVIRMKLGDTRATLAMWAKLEARNRGIISSCINNLLTPYLSLRAAGYLIPGKPESRPLDLDAVFAGKIVIYSVNSVAEPELSSALGKVLKADMYYRLQNRRAGYDEKIRLVGLIFDEYPLVATGPEPRFGDVEQLQTLRSKRGFVVAATQGYSSLNLKLSPEVAAALLINFNNLFFFKSSEPDVEYFAAHHFGVTPEDSTTRHYGSLGTIPGETPWKGNPKFSGVPDSVSVHRTSVPICPRGSLPALATGEAYVSLANGKKWGEPLWVLPTYFTGALPPEQPSPDGTETLIRAIAQLKEPPPIVTSSRAVARDELDVAELEETIEIFGGPVAVTPKEKPFAPVSASQTNPKVEVRALSPFRVRPEKGMPSWIEDTAKTPTVQELMHADEAKRRECYVLDESSLVDDDLIGPPSEDYVPDLSGTPGQERNDKD